MRTRYGERAGSAGPRRTSAPFVTAAPAGRDEPTALRALPVGERPGDCPAGPGLRGGSPAAGRPDWRGRPGPVGIETFTRNPGEREALGRIPEGASLAGLGRARGCRRACRRGL